MVRKATGQFNFIKSFLELVKSYWGYFMTLVAITTFIWTLGIKAERKTHETAAFIKEVTEIKGAQVEERNKLDSVLLIVTEVRDKQSELATNQNALRNSWVRYLSNDERLTKQDFLQYMEGIEFTVKPVPIVDTTKLNAKIVITPIKK
jgi:hypothetical protein